VWGILEPPPGFVPGGQARYQGRNLFDLPARERRSMCGRHIGMIFQDPLSSLNPVFTVGWQLSEMVRVHLGASKQEADERALELLERVGIPSVRDRFDDFPHQFSGGMRQRVIIAMALAVDPALVIADEPTTALDVTVEAQILDLLKKLQREQGLGLILITHSMGVVAEIADHVSVMYAGRVVETGTVRDVFARPAHPYTLGLLTSIAHVGETDRRLVPIPGQPPDLAHIPSGCAFHPRCPFATERCTSEIPDLREAGGPGRARACHVLETVIAAEIGG
ncbi:MAG: ABC transporter ATP-binding protein, partial [Rhodospirillales bacterium]|nr:ABC transporter ATP-binding protein [Rhodospirillales bacterium]